MEFNFRRGWVAAVSAHEEGKKVRFDDISNRVTADAGSSGGTMVSNSQGEGGEGSSTAGENDKKYNLFGPHLKIIILNQPLENDQSSPIIQKLPNTLNLKP